MALIQCVDCGKKISELARSCPECGRPTEIGLGVEVNQTIRPLLPKSRFVYIILGLFFFVGFHNFYSRHYLKGMIKLVPLMITFTMDASTGFHAKFTLLLGFIFGLITIYELFTTTKTKDGADLL